LNVLLNVELLEAGSLKNVQIRIQVWKEDDDVDSTLRLKIQVLGNTAGDGLLRSARRGEHLSELHTSSSVRSRMQEQFELI